MLHLYVRTAEILKFQDYVTLKPDYNDFKQMKKIEILYCFVTQTLPFCAIEISINNEIIAKSPIKDNLVIQGPSNDRYIALYVVFKLS